MKKLKSHVRPVFLLLLSSLAASCMNKPSISPGDNIHPLDVATVGLKSCVGSPVPNAAIVMRIYLRKSADDVFDKNSKNFKAIYYAPPAADPVPADFNPNFGSNQKNTSHDAAIEDNIYSSDLMSLQNIKPGDVIEYRIILDNDKGNSGNSPNYEFYKYDDPRGSGIDIRGVGVGIDSAHDFICSFPIKNETDQSLKKTRDVVDFFVTYKGAGAEKYDSFNIGLVPVVGATLTPVFIDPKILNNG